MHRRAHGTTILNKAFDPATVDAVWALAAIVPGSDPAKRRKDVYGAWIERDQYGVCVEGGTGWEIDHVRAVLNGGSDNLNNLQPLQWQNNRAKGNLSPRQWTPVVSTQEEALAA